MPAPAVLLLAAAVGASNPDKLEAGYGALLPVMVKALQQLDGLCGTLAARVKELEARLG